MGWGTYSVMTGSFAVLSSATSCEASASVMMSEREAASLGIRAVIDQVRVAPGASVPNSSSRPRNAG